MGNKNMAIKEKHKNKTEVREQYEKKDKFEGLFFIFPLVSI
jgi:hypothetical protein